MAVATLMKSSALLGQNVISHHCRALRSSGSRLRSYSSSISLASSVVGFFGIVPSQEYLLFHSTFCAHSFVPGFFAGLPCLHVPLEVSGIATLSSRQRTFETPPVPCLLLQVFLLLWFL